MELSFKSVLTVIFTLFIGMMLTILPIPHQFEWIRPSWVFLILIFWIIIAPDRIGIGIGFVVGIIVDLLTGSLLGQHAFVYSVIAYLVLKFHSQLENLPTWQQSLIIFILSMLNLIICYWILKLSGYSPQSWSYWLSALTNAIIWPWMNWLLHEFSARLKIIA